MHSPRESCTRLCILRRVCVCVFRPSRLFHGLSLLRLQEDEGKGFAAFEVRRRRRARRGGGNTEKVRVMGGVYAPTVSPGPPGPPCGHQAEEGQRTLEAKARCEKNERCCPSCRHEIHNFAPFYRTNPVAFSSSNEVITDAGFWRDVFRCALNKRRRSVEVGETSRG